VTPAKECLDLAGGNAATLQVSTETKENEQRVKPLNVESPPAKPEILAVAATWVVHFSIVITRTIGIVDVGENRGVEAAPFVPMGRECGLFGQILSKGRVFTRAEKRNSLMGRCERTVENCKNSYCTRGRNRIGKSWHQCICSKLAIRLPLSP
jgi:hypothetical protein